MILALIDVTNDCSFAIKFDDASKKEEVKNYMIEGLDAWYSATNPDVYKGEYWNKEEIEAMYGDGYAEPTMDLLKRFNIEAECLEIECDDDDNVINVDEAFYY